MTGRAYPAQPMVFEMDVCPSKIFGIMVFDGIFDGF
jgi:hypothetical protein